MSLLLFDGEVIEIPEYIVRIVKRAQEIVAGENDSALNLTDNGILPSFRTEYSEPTVLDPDGYTQTVSEYILSIIRAAQKIVQEDTKTEDDIRDYDLFIDKTFDDMFKEADLDTSEESMVVVQDVVDKLIEEVCSSPKLKMPQMDTSLVSTEDVHDTVEQSAETDNSVPVDEYISDTIKQAAPENPPLLYKEDIMTTGDNDSADIEQQALKELKPDTAEVINIRQKNTEILNDNDSNSQHNEKVTGNDGIDTEPNIENASLEEISNEELEKIAEKFVEDVCNDVKNVLRIEEENKANEFAETKSDNDVSNVLKDEKLDEKVKLKEDAPKNETEDLQDIKKNEITEGKREADTVKHRKDENSTETDKDSLNNGQIDQTTSPEQTDQTTDSLDNKALNHNAKVYPEDTNPTVSNLEDISESLPSEGKHGKEQKYDLSKDKIKPKRRSRGLRNSFRRLFSCFSTKSSQVE